MSYPVPWLALGSLASGVVALWFVRFLWRYRGRKGGSYFVLSIGCVALWSLSYGVALLVFDPDLRILFEVPIWIAINFIGVCFLAFALEYTGRGNLIRSKFFGSVVAIQSLHTLIVLTNPWHHVAWSNYRVVPVLNSATVVYAHQPWLFVNATGVILLIGAASFLLSDTVFSYGPLYRRQAAAVALSPIFPGVPFLLWLVQVGSSPPLNLTPLIFPVHLAFDMYAFFRRDLFDMVPAARRTAERAAIDDLGTAVVVVDSDDRVIEANREAERLVGTGTDAMLGRPLASVLEGVDTQNEDQRVSLPVENRRREFAVTTSPLTDTHGTTVGSTIVLQDITAERRREQRLAVLNRVLRHNLRNDLNVVTGFVGVAADRVDDEETADLLRRAKANAEEVVDLGEKARDIERALEADSDTAAERVDLVRVLEDVRAAAEEASPDAEITLDADGGLAVTGSDLLLDRVFGNLVENAIEHTDADRPRVDVRARAEEETVVVEVADNGPGIPEHEYEVLAADEETALEHGSGLGLWLVSWGVGSLGGSVEFDGGDDGTTVTVTLPRADDDG